MGDQGYQFDLQSAQRITRSVKAYEQTQALPKNGTLANSRPSPGFWANLTKEQYTNRGTYQWTKQTVSNSPTAGAFDDDAPTSGTNYTAIEVNGSTGLVGNVVQLFFQGYDSSSNPVYLFNCFNPTFVVRLQQSGGSPGSASALCTATYNVFLLDNTTQISTSPVSPYGSACRGFPMKVNTYASYGLGFLDNDGSLQVLDCNESTGNSACS